MIKSEIEYQRARKRLNNEQNAIDRTRSQLKEEGLTTAQVKRVLDPKISLCLKLEEDIHEYECVKRGNIADIEGFTGLGRSLIAMRVSSGKSQKELASQLGIEQPNLCRLERNEYFGARIEVISKVISALGYRVNISFERVS